MTDRVYNWVLEEAADRDNVTIIREGDNVRIVSTEDSPYNVTITREGDNVRIVTTEDPSYVDVPSWIEVKSATVTIVVGPKKVRTSDES